MERMPTEWHFEDDPPHGRLGTMDPIRHEKAQRLREEGKQPYAASYERTHALAEAKDLPEGTSVRVAGRIMLSRDMGKLSFATLQDQSGRLQIALRKEEIGEKEYKDFHALTDLGDIVGVEGDMFVTKTGERTVAVRSWTMLTKTLRQPPEKWHGIADQETAWRQRYLDLQSNPETFDRFLFRSRFLKALREFYWEHGFTEVETPVLTNAASGALATPFKTHHEAYDTDVYLRIAPETFLKECLVGGFDRVFEIARVFRNEGLDPSHLQDFTMVEHYGSYWDYVKNMAFTEAMFARLVPELLGTTKVMIPNRDGELQEVDFAPPFPRFTLEEVIERECGIKIGDHDSASALREAMKSNGIKLDVDVESLGRGNLIDQLYKKVSRPKIVQPTFIMNHPIDLSPLARRNDANPDITDRFQLVVGGWEIVNAYSELVDPVDQAKRFDAQAKAHAAGDTEAHMKDDDFIAALEYGCPPCSGFGMGVDRIVALLTRQTNLRDVVLFPLLKPTHQQEPRQAKKADAKEKELPPGNGSHLLQNADYGHLLPAAHALLEAHADATKAHLIATGAAMEALAKKFGGDAQTWKVAGMLHDLDWDNLGKDAEAHCGDTLEHLLKTIDAPAELLGDIRAHYASKYGADYPLDTMLRKSLYCADELTGFIIAVARVRPSKQIGDVEVSSVTKKLKDKAFAAQVDREQIRQCETLLNVPLNEFVGIVLEAMKGVAKEIGL